MNASDIIAATALGFSAVTWWRGERTSRELKELQFEQHNRQLATDAFKDAVEKLYAQAKNAWPSYVSEVERVQAQQYRRGQPGGPQMLQNIITRILEGGMPVDCPTPRQDVADALVTRSDVERVRLTPQGYVVHFHFHPTNWNIRNA